MNQQFELLTPFLDWTFKQLFTDDTLLKNFLVSVEYGPIEHLEFLDKDLVKTRVDDKESKLDVKAVMQNGLIIYTRFCEQKIHKENGGKRRGKN
jgi:hypothetical protein